MPEAAATDEKAPQLDDDRGIKYAYNSATFLEEKQHILKNAALMVQKLENRGDPGSDRDVDFSSFAKDFMHQVDCMSAEALEDRDIAAAILPLDGDRLMLFSEDIKNNEELVLASIPLDISGSGLAFAGEKLCQSRDFALKAVRKFGRSLEFLRAHVCDREIVLAAVQNYGDALVSACREFREDKEIVLSAVKNKGRALCEAGTSLQADREVVLAAVRQDGYAFAFASAKLQADMDIAKEAVSGNGRALQFASAALRADKSLVLCAVKQEGVLLAAASEDLRADRDVLLAALKQNWHSLAFAHDSTRSDKDLLLWTARWCDDVDTWRHIYNEAFIPVRQTVSWDLFQHAASTAIEIPGQPAPVLSVTLTLRVGQDSGRGIYVGEVALMSGATFTVEIVESDRQDADVGHLSKELVQKLHDHTGVKDAPRIFITFGLGHGEYISVTPWDCDKPLKNYLFSG